HPGRKSLPHDAFVAHRGNIVAGLPSSGIDLGPDIAQTFFEGLELAVAVAIEVEPDLIEIPKSQVDRAVAPPVRRVSLQRDAVTRLDLGNHVRPAADRGS